MPHFDSRKRKSYVVRINNLEKEVNRIYKVNKIWGFKS